MHPCQKQNYWQLQIGLSTTQLWRPNRLVPHMVLSAFTHKPFRSSYEKPFTVHKLSAVPVLKTEALRCVQIDLEMGRPQRFISTGRQKQACLLKSTKSRQIICSIYLTASRRIVAMTFGSVLPVTPLWSMTSASSFCRRTVTF